MPKGHLKLGTPASVNRTVPRRLPNREPRTREHVTEKEVERLIKTAGENRNGHRDATMLLLAFRHGLRASEVCEHAGIRWTLMGRSCTSAGLRSGIVHVFDSGCRRCDCPPDDPMTTYIRVDGLGASRVLDPRLIANTQGGIFVPATGSIP
jgi:site-specific recombinase XerC